MREINRLERLVLDAIESGTDPTLAAVVDYIRARRRLWVWTFAGILLAVLRLEGRGRIEARRSTGEGGHVTWIYRTLTSSTGAGVHCKACIDPITRERRRPGGRGA